MTRPADEVREIEELARKLHEWYLLATEKLNPDSYNPKAQKQYDDLTPEQQSIDTFIAGFVLAWHNQQANAELEACRDANAIKRKELFRATAEIDRIKAVGVEDIYKVIQENEPCTRHECPDCMRASSAIHALYQKGGEGLQGNNCKHFQSYNEIGNTICTYGHKNCEGCYDYEDRNQKGDLKCL